MKNETKRGGHGGWGNLSAADRKARIASMLRKRAENRIANRAAKVEAAMENARRQQTAERFSLAIPDSIIEPALIQPEPRASGRLDIDTLADLIIAVARRMR